MSTIVLDVSAYPHSFNSDHIPVSFVVRANSLQPKNLPRMVYCYKNADFGGLRMSFQNSDWDTALSLENTDEGFDKLLNLFFASVNQFVLVKKLRRCSTPQGLIKKS